MAIKYNSNYDLTIPFSDISVPVRIEAMEMISFTAPGPATKAYSVRFNYDNSVGKIWVRLNAPPVIPVGTVAQVCPYMELRPGYDRTQRFVKGGDVIWMTATVDSILSFSLRELE